MDEEQRAPEIPASLLTIFLVFLKVGTFTFGGGYAMLPVIQREVVTRRKWVDHATFADMLIITQSVPGQLALNSAIQVGVRQRGIPGGAVAGLAVTIPSVLIILAIAIFLFTPYQDIVYVQAVFYGLRPAVVALIAAAAFNLARELLRGWLSAGLALVLLAAALFLPLHPITVLLIGGLAGLILFRKKEV